MQVFLPYPEYYPSLDCLDPSRLGNQVYRECKTILNGGWKHHPVYKMWLPYRYSLCDYAITGLEILKKRGRYYPHWFKYFRELQKTLTDTGKPIWLGDERLHKSHRAMLYWKDPVHYIDFHGDYIDLIGRENTNTSNPPKPEYYWPIQKERE
jgi:hypothetical protein